MATRNERVVLSLTDAGFTTGMIRAAAAAQGLDAAVNDLDGSGVRTRETIPDLADEVDGLGDSARRSSTDLNKFTGRVAALTKAAVTLGPALIPLGASAVPALAGLAAGFGAAAGGASVAMLAFHGVGSSLDALNKYQLDPTAANLEAMRQEFDQLGPAGTEFVRYLDSLGPELEKLQRTAGSGLFPGLEDGLRELTTLMPEVQTIVGNIAETMGSLGADAGRSLANDADWQNFFNYLKTDAAPTLDALGRSLGNFTAGLANMMVAFAPLSRDFSSGMLDMSRSFREWSAGLSNNDSFQSFLDYIRESGPQVKAFISALADAAAGLVTAFAPWGQTVLPVLTSMLNAFAAIASSPIGPALASGTAAMIAFSSASKLVGTTLPNIVGGLTTATKGVSRFSTAARTAAGVGGMLALTTGATQADGAIGVLASTAAGAALGFSVGGPWGAAIGGGVGLLTSLVTATDESTDAMRRQQAEYRANASAAQAAHSKQTLLSAATNGSAAANQLYMQSVRSASAAGRDGAASIKDLRDAMLQQRDAALGGFDANTEYKRALSDAREQASRSSAGIRGMSDAALSNRDALSRLAGSWNTLNRNTGANLKQYRRARQDFLDVAQSMGVPRQAAKRLADQLLSLPKKVPVKVDLDISDAERKARQTRSMFQTLGQMKVNPHIDANDDPLKGKLKISRQTLQAFGHESATPDLKANDNPFRGKLNGAGAGLGSFDRREASATLNAQDNASGTIAGVSGKLSSLDGRSATTYITTVLRTVTQRVTAGLGGLFADGGEIPGPRQPYGDKVLAMLAPGEEVITNRNGEADRFRADRAAGRIPHYADGGAVEIPGYASGGNVYQLARQGRTGRLDRMEISFKRLEHAVDMSRKAIDRERSERDKVRDNLRETRNTVAERLRSDLFDTTAGGSAFSQTNLAGSFGDVLSTLRGDITQGREFRSATSALRAKGLNGGALRALLEQGDAIGFSKLSRSQIQQYERLYNQRQSVTGSAASSAANAVYGRQLAQANKELRQVQRQLKNIRQTLREEHREDRAARKRGAGKAARGRRR